MTYKEVLKSFDNAWIALARKYDKSPSENTRYALNLLREMKGEVASQVEKSNREKQITIEDWIEWLQSKEEKNRI